jgi:ATP-dependent Lhr-like helicase
VETLWTDDGIVVRLPDRERPPDAAALLPDPDEVEELVLRELGGSALFAALFREAASRALLLPRRRPGQRTPLWMQRKRSADLLSVASRYGSFPIILETYREILQDVFDLPALLELLRRLRRRELRVVTVDTATPSPFAASLLFGYVANYIYEGDAPLAERRAQALSVDQAQLRELLGEAELRALLDPQAMGERELALQALDPAHRARSADAVHDLLRRLGPLTAEELSARVAAPAAAQTGAEAAAAWTRQLVAERRAFTLTLAGEQRLAAAEDAGRLRDAFGVPPPRGLPQAFLEPVKDALTEMVARYARTHAPFTAGEAARRYGVGEAPVATALERLGAQGRVVEGEFRPGGHGREWCDAGVLAALRRVSLARLRRQAEPAEPEALARLLVDWQGVASPPATRPGPDALLDVIEQIQGAALPASTLEADVLPARLPGYRPQDLDALCAAGEVVWAGVAPLGERDGRVALYLTDHLPLLHAPAPERPSGAAHDALREHLTRRGASFFAELLAAAGGGLAQPVLDALWDLVWAGEVTNDTPAALRAFLRPPDRAARRRASPFRSRRLAPPSSAGRWSLVGPASDRRAPTPTERAKALAEQLLARHGVLMRQAVLAENVAGGFATLYPVLKALEEAGRVRRGYFVAGLGGSQFALPGALERLRMRRDADAGEELPGVVLAATDPANPYGAALPWPAPLAGKAMRAAGTHVALVDGALAAWMGRGEKEIVTALPEEEPVRSRAGRALARALAAWTARAGRYGIGWTVVDGQPVSRSPLAEYLKEAGFIPWGTGVRLAPVAPADALPAEPAEAIE